MSSSSSSPSNIPATIPPNAAYLSSTSSSKKDSPFTLTKQSSMGEYLRSNKSHVDALKLAHPQIMSLSAKGQTPHTLWIGCSDSRVSECTALGCLPGEVFTLRNIANVMNKEDVSSMSALQFAITVLKVKKIIVCGHTDCGGIWASLKDNSNHGHDHDHDYDHAKEEPSSDKEITYLDQWLERVKNVKNNHMDELLKIDDIDERCKRLVQLNVLNSINCVKNNKYFKEYHERGEVQLYGLVYCVESGYLDQIPLDQNHNEVTSQY